MAKSGWCLAGNCLPGPRTSGCRGNFDFGTCECTCHTGDIPELAHRTLAADEERWGAAAQQLGEDIGPETSESTEEQISA